MLALLAIGGFKGHRDLQRAHVRELAIESKIIEMETEVQRLESRIKALRDDPTSLERMAREQFNMVDPNDVVIVLPGRSIVSLKKEAGPDDHGIGR